MSFLEQIAADDDLFFGSSGLLQRIWAFAKQNGKLINDEDSFVAAAFDMPHSKVQEESIQRFLTEHKHNDSDNVCAVMNPQILQRKKAGAAWKADRRNKELGRAFDAINHKIAHGHYVVTYVVPSPHETFVEYEHRLVQYLQELQCVGYKTTLSNAQLVHVYTAILNCPVRKNLPANVYKASQKLLFALLSGEEGERIKKNIETVSQLV